MNILLTRNEVILGFLDHKPLYYVIQVNWFQTGRYIPKRDAMN